MNQFSTRSSPARHAHPLASLLRLGAIALGATAFLTACAAPSDAGKPPPPQKVADERRPAADQTNQPESSELVAPYGLRKGMPYGQARQAIEQAGWKDGVARSHGAGSFKASARKIASECQGDAQQCNAWPEIESCAGTGEGACTMTWRKPDGSTLRVTTHGGLRHAQVDGWEEDAGAGAAKVSRLACPSRQFPEFLLAYRASVALQRAFTQWPLTYISLDTNTDPVPKEKIGTRSWEQMGGPIMLTSKQLNQSGLRESVSTGPNDTRVVREAGQGNGVLKKYTFRQHEGCWQLVAVNDQST